MHMGKGNVRFNGIGEYGVSEKKRGLGIIVYKQCETIKTTYGSSKEGEYNAL